MSENVIDMAVARMKHRPEAASQARKSGPSWSEDIHTCCAYARMLRAEHDAESARIHFDAKERGLNSWSAANDLRQRTDANNLEWNRYISVLAHIARLPATTRGEASDKRNTIGKMWLKPDNSKEYRPGTIGSCFAAMRAGALADDHLFPPSLKLARRNSKGDHR